ncbi:MAG: hypothetical protein WC517_04100 [Patescibacteria group bacterium]
MLIALGLGILAVLIFMSRTGSVHAAAAFVAAAAFAQNGLDYSITWLSCLFDYTRRLIASWYAYFFSRTD